MARVAHRLLMAAVGLVVLATYTAAGALALFGMAWLATHPPDPVTVAAALAVAALVGAYLTYRVGSARLLAGIETVELPQRRTPELHRRVDRLAEQFGVESPPLLVADLGAPNALSIGGPRESAVVLDRRLLDVLTLDELEGIVAHELAHVQSRDAFVQTLAVSLMRTLFGVLFVCFLPVTLFLAGAARSAAWFAGRPHRGPDVAAAAALGIQLLVGAVLSVLTLGILAHSRRREFAADRRAADATGDPEALARALAKIHRAANPRWGFRSILTIHGEERGGLRRLLSTHPPIRERIDRLVNADPLVGSRRRRPGHSR